jgi:hypothetical protein
MVKRSKMRIGSSRRVLVRSEPAGMFEFVISTVTSPGSQGDVTSKFRGDRLPFAPDKLPRSSSFLGLRASTVCVTVAMS